MNRLFSLTLVSIGILLVVAGITAADSIGSAFTRFFSGVPSDRTFWLLGTGLAALVIGTGRLLREAKVF